MINIHNLKELKYTEFKVVDLAVDSFKIDPISNTKRYSKAKENKTSGVKYNPVIVHYKIDINLADTSQLKIIYGIGSAYSNRIIKYRNLLGGYYHIKQLKEVYGIDSLLFEKINKRVKCDSLYIVKKNLNALEFKEMLKHPYFKYNEVKKIFDLKNNNELNSLKSLIENKIVSSNKLNKLNYYFKVEN